MKLNDVNEKETRVKNVARGWASAAEMSATCPVLNLQTCAPQTSNLSLPDSRSNKERKASCG